MRPNLFERRIFFNSLDEERSRGCVETGLFNSDNVKGTKASLIFLTCLHSYCSFSQRGVFHEIVYEKELFREKGSQKFFPYEIWDQRAIKRN